MNRNEDTNMNQGINAQTKPKEPRKVSLALTIVLVIFTALITFQTTYVVLSIRHTFELNKTKNQVGKFSVLLEALDFFDQNYIYDIDEDLLIDHMLFAFGGQDMYSTYYTYEEFEELIASSQGEAKGIGVYITGTNTAMTVTYVMKDSPAQKAGMLAGDEIVAVDGQKVADIGYNEATNLVIGENGTAVVLTVNRNGQNIDISVIRGDYTPETVLYNCITEGDEKIGYIKIIQFDQITVTQFKTAVEELKNQGCDKFVFDVRSNPGGELTAIVDILDYLLPKGPIVHILDRDMNVEHTYNSDASELKAEMVVLTNGNTASAAELFTSALRDYEKATLVGTKTYGKGCGQDHYFLSNGGVISITSFFYNPPYGENYNGEGIYPNIEVELPEEYENIWMIPFEKDTQLQAAIEKLTK